MFGTLHQKAKMDIALAKKENEMTLAIKEKEFEMRHFKDDEVKKLQEEVRELKQERAVLTKENEMLGKMVDINSDIVDIGELVKTLINKLPEVNLQNLTLSSK